MNCTDCIFILVFVLIVCLFMASIGKTLVGVVTGGGGDTSALAQEYETYLRIRKVIKLVTNREVHSIIERWLLTNANDKGLLSPTDSANRKLASELREKRAGHLYPRILKTLAEPSVSSETPTLVVNNGHIKYGEFTTIIPAQRWELLIQTPGVCTEHVVVCALRYACVMPSSQQWAVPLDDFRSYKDHRRFIEGFASPFNSQIMRLGDLPAGSGFCSLFPDVDAPFGSLGSFFDVDLSNSVAVVNPPFVESLLDAAADKCLAAVGNNNRVIFYGPAWTDASFYKKLSARYKPKQLLPYKYAYEDLFRGTTVVAKFASVVFTLE